MSNKQVWIAVGVAAAVLAFGYLATQREVHATIEAGEATITYQAGFGQGAESASTETENSHEKMMRLIELSSTRIREYDADYVPE